MSKKSSGRSARARTGRPTRQVARPAAVVPVDGAAPVPPAPVPAAVSSFAPTPAVSRVTNRPGQAPRSGRLIPITDYSYVMADLRRIGLLAGAALLVLVGLTFVIH